MNDEATAFGRSKEVIDAAIARRGEQYGKTLTHAANVMALLSHAAGAANVGCMPCLYASMAGVMAIVDLLAAESAGVTPEETEALCNLIVRDINESGLPSHGDPHDGS